MYDTLQQEITDMINQDIIEESDSPYCAPLIMLRKTDGKVRICADMRKVNKITKFDCEPLPDINKIFANIGKSKVLSKLDFCKGYYQIPMRKSDKQITAFNTPFGHFQYKKMAFGLVKSGATYARMMRKVLDNVRNVDNFMDDVIAHDDTFESHLRTLRVIFKRIRQAGLTIKPSKCYFMAV